VLLVDVNVLVYAHRADALDHPRYRDWLTGVRHGASAYGVSDLVLSGFLRVVTHARVFREPTPLDTVLRSVGQVRDRPNCVSVTPGDRHWDIFAGL